MRTRDARWVKEIEYLCGLTGLFCILAIAGLVITALWLLSPWSGFFLIPIIPLWWMSGRFVKTADDIREGRLHYDP